MQPSIAFNCKQKWFDPQEKLSFPIIPGPTPYSEIYMVDFSTSSRSSEHHPNTITTCTKLNEPSDGPEPSEACAQGEMYASPKQNSVHKCRINSINCRITGMFIKFSKHQSNNSANRKAV